MTFGLVQIAFILLIGRIISDAFIALVIKRQFGLFKENVDDYPNVKRVRRVPFGLSIAIFIGNIIPIIIDAVTMFVDTSRPAHLSVLSVSYAMSNMLTSVISSILIWLLYRLAAMGLIPRR